MIDQEMVYLLAFLWGFFFPCSFFFPSRNYLFLFLIFKMQNASWESLEVGKCQKEGVWHQKEGVWHQKPHSRPPSPHFLDWQDLS